MKKEKINKTQLDIFKAAERGLIHRDYYAHALRFNHIIRNASIDETILDIGCGNAQMAMTFYVNKFRPKLYVGIDIRKSIIEDNAKLKFNFECKFLCLNVLKQFQSIPDERFSILTCLEVIEHVEEERGITLLKNLSTRIQPGAVAYISTPCYNGKDKASNHVHEFTYQELKEILRNLFFIESVNGTFISQSDFYSVASQEHKKIFKEMKRYYDSNLCAILFAPLYPEKSRNCIWTLRRKELL